MDENNINERLQAEVAEWKRVAIAQAELHDEAETRANIAEALLRQALKAIEQDAWDTLRERNVAAAIREHLGEPECNHCGGTGDVSGEYPGIACPDCAGTGKDQHK